VPSTPFHLRHGAYDCICGTALTHSQTLSCAMYVYLCSSYTKYNTLLTCNLFWQPQLRGHKTQRKFVENCNHTLNRQVSRVTTDLSEQAFQLVSVLQPKMWIPVCDGDTLTDGDHQQSRHVLCGNYFCEGYFHVPHSSPSLRCAQTIQPRPNRIQKFESSDWLSLVIARYTAN
jgi:hypothetical protein